MATLLMIHNKSKTTERLDQIISVEYFAHKVSSIL